jgi:hypothetical protein
MTTHEAGPLTGRIYSSENNHYAVIVRENTTTVTLFHNLDSLEEAQNVRYLIEDTNSVVATLNGIQDTNPDVKVSYLAKQFITLDTTHAPTETYHYTKEEA